MKSINALTAAKYFIHLGEQAGRKITNKKLQKLLYYAQAWSLVLNRIPMYKEDLEAWIHGPVVPQIYRHYKKFGFDQITENSNFDPTMLLSHKSVLDEVWRVYGKHDADYLELLTHNEDPWIFARSELDSKKASQTVISQDLMLSYYSSMLKQFSKNDKKK